jgi:hypothetical protein
MNETADRVRIVDVKVLSDDWYVLKKTTFDYQRADGSWQRQRRCCFTSRCTAPWCSRASSGYPRSSMVMTGC